MRGVASKHHAQNARAKFRQMERDKVARERAEQQRLAHLHELQEEHHRHIEEALEHPEEQAKPHAKPQQAKPQAVPQATPQAERVQATPQAEVQATLQAEPNEASEDPLSREGAACAGGAACPCDGLLVDAAARVRLSAPTDAPTRGAPERLLRYMGRRSTALARTTSKTRQLSRTTNTTELTGGSARSTQPSRQGVAAYAAGSAAQKVLRRVGAELPSASRLPQPSRMSMQMIRARMSRICSRSTRGSLSPEASTGGGVRV
eukprot:944315-Prymnesium_polylepis.2